MTGRERESARNVAPDDVAAALRRFPSLCDSFAPPGPRRNRAGDRSSRSRGGAPSAGSRSPRASGLRGTAAHRGSSPSVVNKEREETLLRFERGFALYRWAMCQRTWLLLTIAFVLGLAPAVAAQPPEEKYDPGTFRWVIKTSVPDSTNLTPKKNVALENLLRFPHAPGVTKGTRDYLDKRIPHFANNLGLNEGDIISTTGWLHLVATEANDGDYHIQISTRKDSAEPCFIIGSDPA